MNQLPAQPRLCLRPPPTNLAASSALAESCSYPELARSFDAIYDRWLAQIQKDQKNSKQYRRQLFELTGLEPHECPLPRDMDANFRRLYDQADSGIEYGPNDVHGCSIVWKEIHRELFPLCDEIINRPAITLADLALQARAVALQSSEHWLEDMNDFDDSWEGAVALINNLCQFAGIEAMPGLDGQAAT
jgi:hypothetical protein